MYDHTEASYPYECCGLMIGTIGENKKVHAFRTCKNLNTERAHDRYDMDPLDMLRVEREFENSPWECHHFGSKGNRCHRPELGTE